MHPPHLQLALARLAYVESQIDVAPQARELLLRGLSPNALCGLLRLPSHRLPAIFALCALQPYSRATYRTLRDVLATDLVLVWGFVEGLNVLPWLTCMRVFLSLSDRPATSPHVYPFFILVRNKIFYPTDMAGPVYAYHVQGLWDLVEISKQERWQRITPAALAVVHQIHDRLSMPTPDPFTVKLATLLLGGITGQRIACQNLRARKRQPCHSLLCSTAGLTLKHIGRPMLRLHG